MEAKAENDHSVEIKIPLKRFSQIEYPYSEKGGERDGAIKVTCTNQGFAGYQHFCCSDCNQVLKLEPLEICNCHSNSQNAERKYSTIKIGAKCTKCNKTDMIKITFESQLIADMNTGIKRDYDNQHPSKPCKETIGLT
jgi:hypothetical protein